MTNKDDIAALRARVEALEAEQDEAAEYEDYEDGDEDEDADDSVDQSYVPAARPLTTAVGVYEVCDGKFSFLRLPDDPAEVEALRIEVKLLRAIECVMNAGYTVVKRAA